MLASILGEWKKSVFAFILLMIISVLMSACVDMYAGTRPFDYPNSIWVCDEPYIYFTVDADKNIEAYWFNGENFQQFDLCFDYGYGVDALKLDTKLIDNESILFQGSCNFGKIRFTIYLEKDNLWNGKYHKLTFVRTNELPSSTP